MKSTYCEYILEKILSTSEVGPILALIAPSPLHERVIDLSKRSKQDFKKKKKTGKIHTITIKGSEI